MSKIILSIFIFFLITKSSFAYLGPGIGGGVFAATIGILVAIFAALFGLLWFPIKRLIQTRKKNKDHQKNKSD